jgi:predicted Holliday junction resolvase-like endonuclease
LKAPLEVQEVIDSLSRDSLYLGQCPNCEQNFKIKDAHLFYADNLTPEAERSKAEMLQALNELHLEYEHLKARILEGAPKKSLEVIFGQVAEKVAPVMSRFPFDINDCRFLGEPIDYVIFEGMARNSLVSRIVFADVKTGGAHLNLHQKQTKEALERGDVSLELY